MKFLKVCLPAMAVPLLAAWLSAGTVAPARGEDGATVMAAGALATSRIGKLLAGNSIIHPNFGCAYYRPDGTTTQYSRSGNTIDGKWHVQGDIYYSTGQCGGLGCRLIGQYPNLTFRRLDGGDDQPVILIRGNYCEKNGLLS